MDIRCEVITGPDRLFHIWENYIKLFENGIRTKYEFKPVSHTSNNKWKSDTRLVVRLVNGSTNWKSIKEKLGIMAKHFMPLRENTITLQ